MKHFVCILLLLMLISEAFAQRYVAVISTAAGDIEVRLFDDTPMHRDNFIILAKSGYYDSLLFHRVIAGFIIQAGDPTSKTAKSGQLLGEADAGHTVPAEFRTNHPHSKGVLAATRLSDDQNPEKASSGGQFYITVAAANFLDGNYTVFGEVIKGQAVADKISKAATDHNDRPKQDIRITKITINETANRSTR